MADNSLLSQYVEQQQLLLTVTRQIAGSLGLDEIIPHILNSLDRAFDVEGVRLVVTHPECRRMTYATGSGAAAMAPADMLVLDVVLRHGQIEMLRSQLLEQSGDILLLPEEIASIFAIPLLAHQDLHGILWLGFGAPHDFEDSERVFLSILAGQAAIALANARSFDAARKRREWLAAILASTPDPVLVVDRDLCLQLVNPPAAELFSISIDPPIGESLEHVIKADELVGLFGDDRAMDGTSTDYVAENGRTYAPNISDVHTEDGQMAGWVMVLRDITNFKRLNDNMSDFLSTVSHDMRSPLTFMKGYLDMLGMVGDLNERQVGFVEKIASGVIQMSDMVEKILEAGKLDPVTGNYELSREPCDPTEVVRKIVNALAEPAAKKNLTVSTRIAEGIPILSLDQAMLSSAFTNLVENAVKYTPEGGHVEVDLSLDADNLVFRVTDDGYGISPENQAKLFGRNVRVHRKEWKRVKGSGLGLFIVQNVAQLHGGDAWVESVEGQGATFILAIPLEGENLLGQFPPADR